MLSRRLLLSSLFYWAGLPAIHAAAQPTHDNSYDLIVIGSGAAGLCAAYWAWRSGLKQIAILEKEAFIGGASATTIGTFAVAGTQLQIDQRIHDSEEIFIKDILQHGQRLNNPAIVRAHVQSIRKQYEWLMSLGVKAKSISSSNGMTVPRIHRFEPISLFGAIKKALPKTGISIQVQTKATDILTRTDGNVCGVIAEHRGQPIQLRAPAVVLATGGFARNPDLLQRYAPHLSRIVALCPLGSTGDAIAMTEKFGTKIIETENLKANYGFIENPTNSQLYSNVFMSGAIIVDENAHRRLDESSSARHIGDLVLKAKLDRTFLVFDEDIRQRQMKRREIDRYLFSPFDRGETVPYAFRADSIAELARLVHISPSGLSETIEAYNQDLARNGEDTRFGRRHLFGQQGKPVPIRRPPFYIMPAVPAIISTYCGLQIDENARLLDGQGIPLRGLYAAGEVAGGLHGAQFMSGNALGFALSFGRIAGLNAAQYVLGEQK